MNTLAGKPPPHRGAAKPVSGPDSMSPVKQPSRRLSESPRKRNSTLNRQTPLKVKDTSSLQGHADTWGSNTVQNNHQTGSPGDRKAYHRGSDEAMDLLDLENFIANRAARIANSVESFDPNARNGTASPGRDASKRRLTQADIMEQETKLVVLEYLSSATPVQAASRRERPESEREASGVRHSKAFKSHTVHVSDVDRQKLLEDIQAAAKRKTSRSNSDASAEHYSQMRRKFQEMKLPVRNWIDLNLRRDIESFNPSALNTTVTSEKHSPVTFLLSPEKRRFRKVVDRYLIESSSERALKNGVVNDERPGAVLSKAQVEDDSPRDTCAPPCRFAKVLGDESDSDGLMEAELVDVPDVLECEEQTVSLRRVALGRPDALRLAIPHRSVQIVQAACEMTPESFVVNRLESISKEIMIDFPDLVEKPIDALLAPLESQRNMTYEMFETIAKSVYNQSFEDGNTSVWSRIALVLFVVRETMFIGRLDDAQLETMVDHSTKFVAEHAYKDVKIDANSLVVGQYDYSSSDDLVEPDDVDGNRPAGGRKLSSVARPGGDSMTSRLATAVNKYSGYGLAALAFGIGVGLTYLRS